MIKVSAMNSMYLAIAALAVATQAPDVPQVKLIPVYALACASLANINKGTKIVLVLSIAVYISAIEAGTTAFAAQIMIALAASITS